jgi:SWI/SNF-related matrix-associated actin-dependent regulator of chromatin subfamily A containing DEAD/H box 1
LGTKLGQGKKKAGPAGISPRMFEDCAAIFEGYGTVDRILEDCERIGATLRAAIATWASPAAADKGKVKEISLDPFSVFDDSGEGTLNIVSLSPTREQRPKEYLVNQPRLLSSDVQLKEYQLLGVNWLHLLYKKNLSCILADEMGRHFSFSVAPAVTSDLCRAGKDYPSDKFLRSSQGTWEHGSPSRSCAVGVFDVRHLTSVGIHVLSRSSTLENWCREFARFAPSISVQTYYAGKEERPALRQTLLDTQRNGCKSGEGWEVLITTYNLAQGDDRDRKFFRKLEWDVSYAFRLL